MCKTGWQVFIVEFKINSKFINACLDLEDSIKTKPNIKRSNIKLKAYIVIVILFSTKTIGLKIFPDLTADTFLDFIKSFWLENWNPVSYGVIIPQIWRLLVLLGNHCFKIHSWNKFNYVVLEKEYNWIPYSLLRHITVDCGNRILKQSSKSYWKKNPHLKF